MAKAAATKKAAPAPEPEVEETQTGETLTVHDHLIDGALGYDPKFAHKAAKEDMQTYLKRLQHAISEADDKVWQSLPEGAQEWYNQSLEDLKAKKALALPDGLEADAPAAAPKKKSGAEEVAEATEKKKKKAAPAEKAPAKKKEPKEKVARAPGAVTLIRRHLIKKPASTNDDLVAMLEKAGMADTKSTTIAATRTFTLATIADIKTAGKWAE